MLATIASLSDEGLRIRAASSSSVANPGSSNEDLTSISNATLIRSGATMFERVGARIALPDRIALEGLLDIDGPGSKSAFHRLKQAGGRASWSAFREQVAHLRWVDSLGDT
jgi:hypothetical protein